ncbi:response regulator [Colwellia psychrerythraea]|uniref:Two component transcriptional regulator, winged helix family n=1 Tax=Colwellia psychrerythraea TaxID=28229 RepID=A0A099KUU6_COLPS|nr:response regulator [Colwellia psychrerythraea]KGJ93975.1 two component transcriptional regulator, winged helix family [Colwellia psychrerythraea]
MDKQKILIVEDEESIAEVLVAYCQRNGYSAHHLNRGSGVINYIKSNQVDLMLLDLMLPDVDGFEICKQLRLFSQLPVIMVTAKSEEIDRLFGLEFGADDYICKPFSPREVMARIKAVLRRFDNNATQSSSINIIEQSGFIMEPDKYKVTFKGTPLDLTPIEFKVLELLLNNVERVFTRDEIMNKVYLDTVDVSDRNIDTHIKNIRKKIHSISTSSDPICSVYGVGYKCQQTN